MGYVEEDELLATKEWLLKFNQTEHSAELNYSYSEFMDQTRGSSAPVDVVDRENGADGSSRDTIETEPVTSVEPAPAVELLEERSNIVNTESGLLALDYDKYGAWEWAKPIEDMVEEAIFAVLSLDSELPNFSELAASCKLRPRSRGKRARIARGAKLSNRSNDSVVGTIA